jgi:molybdenum cofactor cytidylyltransferase
MPGFADLACIYLAAGEGRRFGGGKLEAMLDGKMLGLHAARTLAACGFTRPVAVCNADNAGLNAGLAALGFDLVIHPSPADGQAGSLALGILQLAGSDAKGTLVALADMPFVTEDHLQQLSNSFDGDRPVCSSNGTTRMPPAIFPQSMWPALQRLSGDKGARNLLSEAVAVEASVAVLSDIDRPEDLPV